MSDDRWGPDEKAAHEAAKLIPIPPRVDPCRKYVDRLSGLRVTGDEIAAFAAEFAKKFGIKVRKK